MEKLPLPMPPEVSVSNDGRRLVAVVVSPTFEGMNESGRQRLVWEHLQTEFELHELRKVEMVLTDSPSEVARLAAG